MSQFERAYRKAIHITPLDVPILKLILGAATAQHLSPRTELFWLIIIGPSSAAKTTLLNPFLTCKDLVVSRDDCTGNAMISASDPDGSRAKASMAGEEDPFDPSLVTMLDGKLFIIKDLTILLNKKEEADKFWGHMRAAYDGRLEKHSGTIGYQGVEKIRYGFIGATTDGSIEGSLTRMSKLGERATYIRMQQDPTTVEQDRVMGFRMLQNRGTQHKREEVLGQSVQRIFRRAIVQVRKVGPSNPRLHDPRIVDRVIHLGSALARLRTAPLEDTQLPHERNPRVVKQFGSVCDAISICSGRRKWSWDEVEICKMIVRGSLPSKVRMLFDYVATCSFSKDASRHPTAATVSRVIGSWRISFAENQLRQWVSVGILRCDLNRRYSLIPEVLEHFANIGVVLRPRGRRKPSHEIRRIKVGGIRLKKG